MDDQYRRISDYLITQKDMAALEVVVRTYERFFIPRVWDVERILQRFVRFGR